ncbi:MAG: homoserine kinase [Firmicutes bacterium]|nr:homoserine kinase [Bacillota bacterium]
MDKPVVPNCRVVVEVPATVANLGAGFDVLGMALELRNTYDFRFVDSGVSIVISGEGAASLPHDETHLGYQACLHTLRKLGYELGGVELRQKNRVPLAGGLGNSATAVVAGVLAANAAAGYPLSPRELLAEATAIEGHPDNVAPALQGGLVICVNREDGEVQSLRLDVPSTLMTVVAVPDFCVDTAQARRVLPRYVSLSDAVYNVGRASLLVGAICSGEFEHLEESMQDRLHQPYRRHLIPGLYEVCSAARQAGAAGASLAGAGPTVVALVTEEIHKAEMIGQAMTQAFLEAGVSARYLVLAPTATGATVETAVVSV